MRNQAEVRRKKGIRGFSLPWARAVVLRTLVLEKVRGRHLGVWFTDDREIRRVNRRFLKHDAATDVIAFPYGEGRLFGEVVVSVDTASRAASRLRVGFKEELARYLVHGVLHLLGYDDIEPRARRRMIRRQEDILKKIFLGEKYR
ncbi:MAG: rRNA maturation RNase YbeY [Candidatus Omnitrophica bacterium]|nr:rRNA maturation RNase YbeY [Candidatus Omnitrophota bacterium]